MNFMRLLRGFQLDNDSFLFFHWVDFDAARFRELICELEVVIWILKNNNLWIAKGADHGNWFTRLFQFTSWSISFLVVIPCQSQFVKFTQLYQKYPGRILIPNSCSLALCLFFSLSSILLTSFWPGSLTSMAIKPNPIYLKELPK